MESPSKATNNDAEGVQVDGDITESSSNRDYNEETPLIAGKQQYPSDSREPALHAERVSQVEDQQSNCNDSVDNDLRKQL